MMTICHTINSVRARMVIGRHEEAMTARFSTSLGPSVSLSAGTCPGLEESSEGWVGFIHGGLLASLLVRRAYTRWTSSFVSPTPK